MTGITRVATGLLLAVVTVTGCSIQPESTPRNVPEDQRGLFDAQTTTGGGAAAGDNRIYLLASLRGDAQQQLRSVLRDVPSQPLDLLTSLVAGPNDEERDELLDTALPEDLVINSARRSGPVVLIDVNDALNALSQDGLRLAIAQLVLTITDLPGVEEVEITVEGSRQLWPLGDRELTDRPLTRFDYPGLAESTQPRFPPIPAQLVVEG
jgi:spore germination protein GerM